MAACGLWPRVSSVGALRGLLRGGRSLCDAQVAAGKPGHLAGRDRPNQPPPSAMAAYGRLRRQWPGAAIGGAWIGFADGGVPPPYAQLRWATNYLG